MDLVLLPSLRSPPQPSERPPVPPLFPLAASHVLPHLFSFLPCPQVSLPVLLEPPALLWPAPRVLQLAAQAWSLRSKLALALPVWLGLVPQVSPVSAKLALPESAPTVLLEPAYPVSPLLACPAWQVAALFGRPDLRRSFRWPMQARLFARASMELSPRSRALLRVLLLNA